MCFNDLEMLNLLIGILILSQILLLSQLPQNMIYENSQKWLENDQIKKKFAQAWNQIP